VDKAASKINTTYIAKATIGIKNIGAEELDEEVAETMVFSLIFLSL